MTIQSNDLEALHALGDLGDLICAFMRADVAWQAELVAAFGDDAGQARYERRGRGTFEDALGRAWLARDKARRAHITAIDRMAETLIWED